MSCSDVRKASKKRRHLDRYFTFLLELSRSVEETSTSATAEDSITTANEKRLNVKVVMFTSTSHCYRDI